MFIKLSTKLTVALRFVATLSVVILPGCYKSRNGWGCVGGWAGGIDLHHKGQASTEYRYYLISLTDLLRFAGTVRAAIGR
ncbi:MAG TPA: hypothetical protein VIF37_12625 [Methylobacter sp.]